VTVNNRWVQLVASLIAMIMIANLQYSWTLFVEPMKTATGWKLSDIQWAFTLFILFQTWVQPAQGFLIDRLGPRVFTTIAGVLCGIGWTGLGVATSLPMLYTLYVIAGIGAALIYGGCMGSALKWFTTQRGLAAGLIAAGFGGGTALFIPFIASIIKTTGYQSAFIYTGVFQAVVILIVAQFLRHPARQPQPAKSSRRFISARPTSVHDLRDVAHAAILRALRQFRDDGHRRSAGDGQRRLDREGLGNSGHGAGRGDVAECAGQWRQPHFLGLGVRPNRP
jgi:MFS family permease